MNIKRTFAVVAGAMVLVTLVVVPTGSISHKPSQFTSAGIASASEIQYPVNTMAAGAVSLLLNLDTSGKVQNVQVLRDFPSLTSPVQSAVQSWAFTPAAQYGKPISSSIPVTVIFNIFNPGGGGASRTLIFAPAQSIPPDASQFMPPQITAASYANYPANSVSQGTVVLDVSVSDAGQPKTIRVVRGVPTLTEQAVSTVKTWGFNAATVQGQPIAAHIIIAFVFRRNIG